MRCSGSASSARRLACRLELPQSVPMVVNFFSGKEAGSRDAAQQIVLCVERTHAKTMRKEAIVGVVAITTLPRSVFCISCPPTETPEMSINQIY